MIVTTAGSQDQKVSSQNLKETIKNKVHFPGLSVMFCACIGNGFCRGNKGGGREKYFSVRYAFSCVQCWGAMATSAARRVGKFPIVTAKLHKRTLQCSACITERVARLNDSWLSHSKTIKITRREKLWLYDFLPVLLKGLHDSMIADLPIAKQSKLLEWKKLRLLFSACIIKRVAGLNDSWLSHCKTSHNYQSGTVQETTMYVKKQCCWMVSLQQTSIYASLRFFFY